jgi:GcrA cell cycle regulator
MTWSDPARVELLKNLWAEGRSASQIAVVIGGTTRAAVIGKVHRLGLPLRGKATPRTASAPRRAAPRPRSKPVMPCPAMQRPRDERGHLEGSPLPPAQEGDTPRVATLDLEPHHCRWAVGDPLEAGATKPLFCGTTRVRGLSYCEAHARRAYNRPTVAELEPVVVPASTHEMETAA